MVTVAVITFVLVDALVQSTGRFDPEGVLVPVAAVWETVALYRGQQRDAAIRQRLVEELRDTRDTLARQQRQAGAMAEHTRIARDLHDTLARELAGSLMLLQAAERDGDARPEVTRTRVRAVADGLGSNLAETRRMIRDLTPPTVAEAGLEGALRLPCDRSRQEGAVARVRSAHSERISPPSTTRPPPPCSASPRTPWRTYANTPTRWTYWSPSTGTPIVSNSK
jgi:signal transduction histidine kinase